MHIMVDLETLGTGPRAPIISIGAVAFTRSDIKYNFYMNVDFSSAVSHGEVCGETLKFWFKQDEDARTRFFKAPIPQDLKFVLERFNDFIEESLNGEVLDGVWGNGATFDNVILDSAYKSTAVIKPWAFWQDRCYRTMKSEFKSVPFEREGTHHNALDDARSQAQHLIKIWELIDAKVK